MSRLRAGRLFGPLYERSRPDFHPHRGVKDLDLVDEPGDPGEPLMNEEDLRGRELSAGLRYGVLDHQAPETFLVENVCRDPGLGRCKGRGGRDEHRATDGDDGRPQAKIQPSINAVLACRVPPCCGSNPRGDMQHRSASPFLAAPPINDGLADLHRNRPAGDDQVHRLRADIEEDVAIEDVLVLVAKRLARRLELTGEAVDLHGRLFASSLPDVLEGVNRPTLDPIASPEFSSTMIPWVWML